MVNINIAKKETCPWSKVKIKKIIQSVAVSEKKLKGEIEINIISEKEMRILNGRYRGQKRVTDVLAFAWQEDKIISGDFLGQIYICYSQIVKQAKALEITAKEEFSRVLVHGLLHLVGYDHQTEAEAKKMFVLQEKIAVEVKNYVKHA